MTDHKSSLNELIARAREAAQAAPDQNTTALLLEVCSAASDLMDKQDEIRKEAFRDGIRGAAKVIRNRQAAPGSALSELFTGDGGNPDVFADELTGIADNLTVTVADLRKLRQKINSAAEGADDIDDDIRRVYYSVMNERNPTSADVLPPGSPSRSLDVATFVIEKILRKGWWTLGNSGVDADDKPVGKVGLSANESSKPQSAATPPLTLLSTLVLALIESSKSR
ncbi:MULTISPECIES: hypothetical protein [Rhizobium/Agrobacterium group]|jgi:hypothetical protein|uniref:hypothetical protein n=1 Tax=Rhizobium/Agrobacterium group TaxID=227290 RepID=UPI0007130C98|nr:hypothetical protein [Rhizobium sp. Root483D2]KQY48970.1 hypothetical protein ASD32_01365 [Rhizobium sp. Root483D2]